MTGQAPGLSLAELILAEAERGGAGPGTRLPTERQLAADFGVTRTAIRHAMGMLEAQGRVSREVGRGTYLRQVPGGTPAANGEGDRGRAGSHGRAGSRGPGRDRGRVRLRRGRRPTSPRPT